MSSNGPTRQHYRMACGDSSMPATSKPAGKAAKQFSRGGKASKAGRSMKGAKKMY